MSRSTGRGKRLRLLSVHDRRALLDGVWELDEGRYFSRAVLAVLLAAALVAAVGLLTVPVLGGCL